MSHASPAPANAPPVAARANGDWNLLFEAVLARLRHEVAAPAAASPALQASVDDCLHALAQLQASLVGERAAAQARLHPARHRAELEDLTAPPTRGRLQSRGGDALAAPLAVLFVDLDDFKAVNDRHGQAIGDQVLCIVAQRMHRAVRAQDLVCRVEADGFACLLADTLGRAQLSRLASQLFDTVSAPMRVGTLQLSVRPSIGIAVCPEDGQSVDVLLQHADAAMDHAKRDQLGYAFFATLGKAPAPSTQVPSVR